MNRIVREHYPVEKLPEDLRAGFPAGSFVRVTLVVGDEKSDEAILSDLDRKLEAARCAVEAGLGLGPDEVLKAIEAQELKWLAKAR
jgi:hypothetical protein